jgi:hypothetical protein
LPLNSAASQDRQSLVRQRHAVRLALFHPFSRDRPKRLVEIDLTPFGFPYFAKALEDVGREAQG